MEALVYVILILTVLMVVYRIEIFIQPLIFIKRYRKWLDILERKVRERDKKALIIYYFIWCVYIFYFYGVTYILGTLLNLLRYA